MNKTRFEKVLEILREVFYIASIVEQRISERQRAKNKQGGDPAPVPAG